MSSAECWTDDGLHAWSWTVSRWTGQGHYACDYCSRVVFVWGDDDDDAYMTDVLGGRIVGRVAP